MLSEKFQLFLTTFHDSLIFEIDIEPESPTASILPYNYKRTISSTHNQLYRAFKDYFKGIPLSPNFLIQQEKKWLETITFGEVFNDSFKSIFGNKEETLSSLLDYFVHTLSRSPEGNESDTIHIWVKKIAYNFLLKLSLEQAIVDALHHTGDFDEILSNGNLKEKLLSQISPKISVIQPHLRQFQTLTFFTISSEDRKALRHQEYNNRADGLFFSQILLYAAVLGALFAVINIIQHYEQLVNMSVQQLLTIGTKIVLTLAAAVGICTGVYYLAKFIANQVVHSRKNNERSIGLPKFDYNEPSINLHEFDPTVSPIELSTFDNMFQQIANTHPKTLNVFLTKINPSFSPQPSAKQQNFLTAT